MMQKDKKSFNKWHIFDSWTVCRYFVLILFIHLHKFVSTFLFFFNILLQNQDMQWGLFWKAAHTKQMCDSTGCRFRDCTFWSACVCGRGGVMEGGRRGGRVWDYSLVNLTGRSSSSGSSSAVGGGGGGGWSADQLLLYYTQPKHYCSSPKWVWSLGVDIEITLKLKVKSSTCKKRTQRVHSPVTRVSKQNPRADFTAQFTVLITTIIIIISIIIIFIIKAYFRFL